MSLQIVALIAFASTTAYIMIRGIVEAYEYDTKKEVFRKLKFILKKKGIKTDNPSYISFEDENIKKKYIYIK